jgi:hypothetical protein
MQHLKEAQLSTKSNMEDWFLSNIAVPTSSLI